MKGSKVIFLLNNSYGPDSRVENEINVLLSEGMSIDLYCVSSPDLPEFEDLGSLRILRSITPQLYRPFSREYRTFVAAFSESIAREKPGLIHCHDFQMFFLGCRIKSLWPEAKIIYDSHEYLIGYPYFYRIPSWKSKFKGFFIWLYYVIQEIYSLRKATAIVTVSESLRQKFEKRSKINCVLVRNIPPRSEICLENCDYWHSSYNLSSDTKIIIHTGNAFFSKRRLGFLLDELSERQNLALVFLGSNNSLLEINREVENRKMKNVFFHEQVPRKYVPYYCSQANFGLVYTWNPAWRSYWYALPNKLMDVSLAGIPVLSTSQPELKRFINQEGNGVCFHGQRRKYLRTALNEIIEREVELRKKAFTVRDRVNWEVEGKMITGLYRQLLK